MGRRRRRRQEQTETHPPTHPPTHLPVHVLVAEPSCMHPCQRFPQLLGEEEEVGGWERVGGWVGGGPTPVLEEGVEIDTVGGWLVLWVGGWVGGRRR